MTEAKEGMDRFVNKGGGLTRGGATVLLLTGVTSGIGGGVLGEELSEDTATFVGEGLQKIGLPGIDADTIQRLGDVGGFLGLFGGVLLFAVAWLVSGEGGYRKGKR